MRVLSFFVLFAVLGVGVSFGYYMYRQLGTGTVTLSATPEFAPTADGSLCSSVDLTLSARSLSRWPLLMEDGQNLSGSFAVKGGPGTDIGFSIWSPTNRVVHLEPKRIHGGEFELLSTIRGEYDFEFDNRHSTFTGKHIELELCVS